MDLESLRFEVGVFLGVGLAGFIGVWVFFL